MIKDPEFIQEFKKVTRSDPHFQVGGEADKLISKLVWLRRLSMRHQIRPTAMRKSLTLTAFMGTA